MKKVAIDAMYLNSRGSGINIYLLKLIESLRSHEYLEITYLVDRMPKDFHLNDNEKIIVLKKFRSRIIWEQFSLAVHLLKNQYDVILIPGNFGFPLFLKKRGAKCVLILHDLIPIEMPSYIFRRWHYTIPFYLSVPISVFKSNLIITGSSYSARSIKKLFHRQAKVFYPPLDFTPINKTIPGSLIREKYHIKSRQYFIYTGGYDPRKNVMNILEAFKKFLELHDEYSLVMTGHLAKKYLRIIKDFSAIIPVGYVAEQDKKSLIKNASALVNASSMEGFGLPVVEAFRLGTPVITTVNSSLKEVVNDAGIHITDSSTKSILKAMDVLSKLSNSELQHQTILGYKQLELLNKTNSGPRLVRLILS